MDEEITEQDLILRGYQKEEVSIIPSKPEGPQPSQFCDGIARSFSITAAHKEPGGIGYKKGYTSLGVLISPKDYRWIVPFLDVRAHLFNDGKWAANAGAGIRYRQDERKVVWGLNAYYDYRRSNNHNFNQVGVGVELLGQRFYLVTNAYFPVGRTKKIKNYTFNRFSGLHVVFDENAKVAMAGVEGRIGGRIFSYRNLDLYFEGGPYYFKGSFGKKAFGARGGLFTKIYEIFQVGITGSYDEVFKTKIQGNVSIRFPFGRRMKSLHQSSSASEMSKLPLITCAEDESIMKRMVEPPNRHEIIVLSDQSKSHTAKDPDSKEPYIFYHVNNLVSSFGNGTFEAPFNTLANAQAISLPGDYIFVHYGNGTPLGMNAGFILQDNQSILGSAVEHLIVSNPAEFTIPAFTPGLFPEVTNNTVGGFGITLADNNLIEGLSVSAASGSGIHATNPTFASRIRNNRILDNGPGAGADAGITLLLGSGITIGGTWEITNNLITATTGGTDGIFIGRPTGAITVDGPAGMDVKITGNTIAGNPSEGIHFDRSSAGTTGVFTLSGEISSNIFTGNALDGIFFEHLVTVPSNSFNLNLAIRNNTFTTNGSDGININRASGRMIVEGNHFATQPATGFFIDVGTAGGGGIPDSLSVDILNNFIVDNTGSTELQLSNGSIDARVIGNFFSRLIPTTATFFILDNNTGTGAGNANFKVFLRDNEGPLSADNVFIVP